MPTPDPAAPATACGGEVVARGVGWGRILLRAFAAVVLLALAAVGIGSLWVVGWLQTELQAALERVFQTRYLISGFSVNVFPPGINLASLRVFLDDREVLSGREVRVDVDWTDERLEVARLEIHGGHVTVIRDEEGGYSFTKVLRGERFTEGLEGPGRGRARRLPLVEIFGASVTYEDPRLIRSVTIRDASAIVRPLEESGAYMTKVSGTPAGGGRLTVDGMFTLRRDRSRGEFKWRLTGVDGREISSVFSAGLPLLSGTFDGVGILEGPIRAPVLEGRLTVPELAIGQVDGRPRLEATGFEMVLHADRERVNASPSAQVVVLRDERLGEPLRIEETGGRIGFSAEVEAFRQPPGWKVAGYSPVGRLGGYTYGGLAVGVSGSTSGVVALHDFRVDLSGAKLEAKGAVDPWSRSSRLTFRVEDLDLAPLSNPRTGNLTGTCTVAGSLGGTWEAPAIEGRVHVRALDWTREPMEIDLEHLSASFKASKVETAWTGEIDELKGRILGGGMLTGGGKLDAKGGARLAVQGLEAKNLFRALAVPGASARGKIDVAGTLVRWQRVVPEVEMKVSAPALRLFLEPGGQKILLDLEQVASEVALGPTREGAKLNFLGFSAKALGGKVTGKGTIRIQPRLGYDLALGLAQGSSKEVSNLVGREDFSLLGKADLAVRLKGDAGKATLEGTAALGDSKIYVKVGGKPIILYPTTLGGPIRVAPDEIALGPLEGKLAGGKLGLFYRLDLADKQQPWKTTFQAEAVDAKLFFPPYLAQPHDLAGRMSADLVVNGRGQDKGSVTGTGSLVMAGRIEHLQALTEAEKEYRLRNLSKIEIKKAAGRLAVYSGKLRLRDMVIESSHGLARSELDIELASGAVEGKSDVALDRKVLGSAHRLLAFLEGGRYFNFSTHLAGTMLAPEWRFSSRRAQVEKPASAGAVFKAGR